MRRFKKAAALLLAATMLTGLGSMEAFAKSKINSVSIKIETEIQPDTEYGTEEIEVSVKTGKCSFMDYEILNDDNEWSSDMVPKIQIILEADDDYYFPSSLTASKIKISGGTYVSAVRAESSTQLKITVTLPSLTSFVGEMKDVRLDQNGMASWEPVVGAAQYNVRLYRDGGSVNTAAVTKKTSYDLSPAMLRSGTYYVRVRAINGVDENNKSEQMDSNSVGISEQTAALNKENNTSKPGEWIQNITGWWYCHGDGSYTSSGWEKIHGSWYAFDEAGYMRTGWVTLDGSTYYFNPDNGAMMTNTTVEGRVLGEEGVMIQ